MRLLHRQKQAGACSGESSIYLTFLVHEKFSILFKAYSISYPLHGTIQTIEKELTTGKCRWNVRIIPCNPFGGLVGEF
jgi:hypothetical protein